jgi:hypothetical protein
MKGFPDLFIFFLFTGDPNLIYGLWQQHRQKLKELTKPNSTRMGTTAEKQQ